MYGGAAANSLSDGPANLATIRVAVIAALKDVDYLHISEGRGDHATPVEAFHLYALD